MVNNTHNNEPQWWAKVDLKQWIAIIGVFVLVSGGVDSIKSAVNEIKETQRAQSKDAEEIKILHKEMTLEIKKLITNDMRQDYDILDLKKRVDKLENL